MIHDKREEEQKKAELGIMQDLKRKRCFNFVFLNVNKLEFNNVFKKSPGIYLWVHALEIVVYVQVLCKVQSVKSRTFLTFLRPFSA